MKRILMIQTAFIGDVILATSMIESLHASHPEAAIDFVCRKGNEGLLENHPKLDRLIVWDKTQKKYANLKATIKVIRAVEYDLLINLQRFGSSGYMSMRSKAKRKVGFKKNPFSFCYDLKAPHEIGNGTHEVERNFELIKDMVKEMVLPKLYPTPEQYQRVESLISTEDLVVMAPSSVWFTKQLPFAKWVELIKQYPESKNIALIGAPSDKEYLEKLKDAVEGYQIRNLAGELSLLESAALISKAAHTHVNDSAPLHLASAMNSRVTAYFCSTVPSFGFGPLSTQSEVKETAESLSCRPCGLHGKSACPEGHFNCGKYLDVTLS